MANPSKMSIFVSSINVACKAHKAFAFVPYTKQNLLLLNLLVDQGCFRYYSIIYKLLKCGITWLSVKVFLIYIAGSDSLIKEFILVSKVSKRVYWTLDILFMNFSKRAFSGFYIISTSKGLCSSAELIWRIPLMGKMSGEILLKVSF